MEKNRIKIIIDGQTYNVISDEDELHVMKVAEAVDKQIQSIKKKAGHLTPTMIAVLGAMNITDEYLKYREAENESDAMKEKNAEIERLNTVVADLQKEIVDQSDLNDKSNEQVMFLQRKLTEKQETIEKLELAAQDETVLQKLNQRITELEHSLEEQRALNNELIGKREDSDGLAKKIAEIQQIADEKDEMNRQLLVQIEEIEKQNQELLDGRQDVDEQLAFDSADDSKVFELEAQLNQSRQQIMEFDEKIFYLQRKLTDKEEELQSTKRELEDFITEFEK